MNPNLRRRQITEPEHKWQGNFYETGESRHNLITLDEDGQVKRIPLDKDLQKLIEGIDLAEEVKISVGEKLSYSDELMRQSELIMKAKIKATLTYEGKVDESGSPLINHLKSVASQGENCLEVTAGWLSRILEDTDCTLEELEKEFGKDVAKAVSAINEKLSN